MARQLIADPFTPRKIRDGRLDEIGACIGCNDGCIARVVQEKGIRCVHNPGAGQEIRLSERLLTPRTRSRRVVIVGGGPAGLKVAECAALCGHSVTLIERDAGLGGLARLAARQPFHEEFAEVTAYLEGAIERLNVDVWLNVEATAEQLVEFSPDVIVVATSSEPPILRKGIRQEETGLARAADLGLVAPIPLPGLHRDIVFSTDDVLCGIDLPGKDVLVIDESGHWEATGTAEYLVDAGYRVRIVTSRSTPGFGLEATNLALFLQRAKQKGIVLTPNVEVREIGESSVEAIDQLSGRPLQISAEIVVPVYPRRSRSDLYFELEGLVEANPGIELHRVGDASSPRLIEVHMVEAEKLAMGF